MSLLILVWQFVTPLVLLSSFHDVLFPVSSLGLFLTWQKLLWSGHSSWKFFNSSLFPCCFHWWLGWSCPCVEVPQVHGPFSHSVCGFSSLGSSFCSPSSFICHKPKYWWPSSVTWCGISQFFRMNPGMSYAIKQSTQFTTGIGLAAYSCRNTPRRGWKGQAAILFTQVSNYP